MQTGQITEDRTSFDISDLDETNSVLVRNHGITKFIYKDEQDRAVILTRTEAIPSVAARGTMCEISEVPGYAEPVFAGGISAVATLLTDVDWDALESGADTSLKTVTFDHDGVGRFAVLAPCFLKI